MTWEWICSNFRLEVLPVQVCAIRVESFPAKKRPHLCWICTILHREQEVIGRGVWPARPWCEQDVLPLLPYSREHTHEHGLDDAWQCLIRQSKDSCGGHYLQQGKSKHHQKMCVQECWCDLRDDLVHRWYRDCRHRRNRGLVGMGQRVPSLKYLETWYDLQEEGRMRSVHLDLEDSRGWRTFDKRFQREKWLSWIGAC